MARADFAPRIVTRGSLFDYQQSSPRGHFDIALGYIGLEWGLFDGGRRVGELRVANSRIREALAQADSIADTIDKAKCRFHTAGRRRQYGVTASDARNKPRMAPMGTDRSNWVYNGPTHDSQAALLLPDGFALAPAAVSLPDK